MQVGNSHSTGFALGMYGLCFIDRNPDEAAELLRLRDKKPDKLVVKRLDVTAYDTLAEFVEEIKVSGLRWLKIYM